MQLCELFAEVKLFERLGQSMLQELQTKQKNLAQNPLINKKTRHAKRRAYQLNGEMFAMVTSSKEWQNEQVKVLFNLLDSDHSGTISLKEFLAGIVLMLGDRSQQFELMFDIFDSDHSGTLSLEELKSGLPLALRNNFFMFMTSLTTGYAGGSLSELRQNLVVKEDAKASLFRALFRTFDILWKTFEPVLNTKLRSYAEKLFDAADVNKDKSLSRSEFIDFMKFDTSLKKERERLIGPELALLLHNLDRTFEKWIVMEVGKGSLKKRACSIC